MVTSGRAGEGGNQGFTALDAVLVSNGGIINDEHIFIGFSLPEYTTAMPPCSTISGRSRDVWQRIGGYLGGWGFYKNSVT